MKSLVSVGWCPDKGTPPKLKMTFASTKTAFEVRSHRSHAARARAPIRSLLRATVFCLMLTMCVFVSLSVAFV